MSFDPVTFYSRTRAARKIIVVDLGFLGDSVHLIPALWEMKRHYPEAQLHTLSAVVGSEVLQLAPCVDRAWTFPLGSPSPPWWRHWDIIRNLRRERFDLAFNFSGADRTVFLTALTGAKWRLAHAAGRKHFWNPWLIRTWIPRRSTALPVYEQRRQVLAACGINLAPPRWELAIPTGAARQMEATVPAGAVHISINASTPLKEWPLRHWVALVKGLLAENSDMRIVATAARPERESQRLLALVEGVADQRLLPLKAGMAIADLAGVLTRCCLHVGADSGVLHLAAALGLPTVAIFRDYSGAPEWLPHGPEHQHLLAPCPCAKLRAAPCEEPGEALCLAGLAPERVLALVQGSLRRAHPGAVDKQIRPSTQ